MLLVVMVCSPFCFSWCGGVACSFVVVVYARVGVPLARGGCGSGAVASGLVVAVRAWRGLCLVFVCRGGGCVCLVVVCVVVFLVVFGVGVRGVCCVVVVLVGVFGVVSVVRASRAAFGGGVWVLLAGLSG